MCQDIFGNSFNKTNIQSGVKQTNTNYGGKGIASSKVGQCYTCYQNVMILNVECVI